MLYPQMALFQVMSTSVTYSRAFCAATDNSSRRTAANIMHGSSSQPPTRQPPGGTSSILFSDAARTVPGGTGPPNSSDSRFPLKRGLPRTPTLLHTPPGSPLVAPPSPGPSTLPEPSVSGGKRPRPPTPPGVDVVMDDESTVSESYWCDGGGCCSCTKSSQPLPWAHCPCAYYANPPSHQYDDQIHETERNQR